MKKILKAQKWALGLYALCLMSVLNGTDDKDRFPFLNDEILNGTLLQEICLQCPKGEIRQACQKLNDIAKDHHANGGPYGSDDKGSWVFSHAGTEDGRTKNSECKKYDEKMREPIRTILYSVPDWKKKEEYDKYRGLVERLREDYRNRLYREEQERKAKERAYKF